MLMRPSHRLFSIIDGAVEVPYCVVLGSDSPALGLGFLVGMVWIPRGLGSSASSSGSKVYVDRVIVNSRRADISHARRALELDLAYHSHHNNPSVCKRRTYAVDSAK